jgi:hypothetical protein
VITLECFAQPAARTETIESAVHPDCRWMRAPAGAFLQPVSALWPRPAARGLTGRCLPLYSAGFATSPAGERFESPCGGIGRRARLKIEFRKECWFDSGQGHQKRFTWFDVFLEPTESDIADGERYSDPLARSLGR